jgi:putative DNA methylase
MNPKTTRPKKKVKEPQVEMKSPRLVEEGLLDIESSSGGLAERYRRGETPHTIHVWWARRPHSAMRALVFSAIAASDDPASQRLLPQIAASSLLPPELLNEVREAIAGMWPESPRVLDMFGGGGTIPFEAATLGAETFSIDSNELSVFLQKTLLHDSLKIPNIGKLVSESGDAVLKRLVQTSKILFPMRDSIFGYLWTYAWPCSKCGYEFLIPKRPWLSKKGNKRLAISIVPGQTRDTTAIVDVSDDYEFKSPWSGRSGTVVCPKCGMTCKSLTTAVAKDRLVATISHAIGSGKVFNLADEACLPPKRVVDEVTAAALKSLNAELPTSELPKWSGIVNPTLYGIDTHADFVNPRQRAVILLLLKELRDEYIELTRNHSLETAKAVIAILSGLVDQLVDWNCRISMWISQNEQVGRAFSGPGVPMLWDYAELDPACDGPANLWSKLKRLVAGTTALSNLKNPVNVRKAFAQSLPFEDNSFDAIVTDPPYYDNVYYNVLADFFYAWKRLLFKEIEPNLFHASTTDSSRELVASTFRSGSDTKAHVDYCREFGLAISEAARVLRPNGVFCLVYSHSAIRGWEAILQAYRSSALEVSSVQPLCIERKARPRAMTSDAVNTCVVFVARKRTQKRIDITFEKLQDQLIAEGRPVVDLLRQAGWSEQDVGLSLFAKGVGLVSNFEVVKGRLTDNEILLDVETLVRSVVPTFKIAKRKSL